MADPSVKAEVREFLHHLVANTFEVDGKTGSEEFQVFLMDSSLRLLEHLISKLADFANHAKRNKININDVYIYLRSHPVVLSALKDDMIEEDVDEITSSSCSVLPLVDDSN